MFGVNYIKNKYQNEKYVIIDGARYENEIMMLKENGFFLIKLNISYELQEKRIKNLYKNNYQEHIIKRNHTSETSVDFINNSIFNLIIDVDHHDIKNIIKHIVI
jgi:hypothetical protein